MLMIIHALGVDKYVVVVKLLCFYHFCENGLKTEKFDFDEFEWIDENLLEWIRMIRIYVLNC